MADQTPYTGPIPPGAGVAGITLWSRERREKWFEQIAKQNKEKQG